MKLITLLKYLRFKSFDVTTSKGRSDERYRLAALAMAANFFSRGISMLVMVFTVSLTVPYLGSERFGVWMTIASFVGMLTFLDLGVGNALTNKVAQVAAGKDSAALKTTISGGLGFLLLLGCVVSLLLYGLVNVLPWHRLIKLKDVTLHGELLFSMGVFAVLFGLNLFTSGIQRIFAGLQRSFEAHLISVLGSLFSLLALWIFTRQEAGIPYLLAATLGIQSLANLNLLLILIRRNLFSFRCLIFNTRLESRSLLHVGGLFFILQIGTMVGWGADSLIISSTLGAAQVAVFSIVQRLFQLATQPMNILNAPLWAAYADAHSRGDKQFIKSTLKKSLIGTGGFCLLISAILLMVGDFLVEIWTGNEIRIPVNILFAYASWATFMAIGNALAMFLNGCSIVKQQVPTVMIFLVISIPTKLFLINFYGLEAMLIGQALIYLIITSVSYGIIFRKKLSEICV